MLMPSASSADEDLYRLCSEVGEHGEMPIILQNAPPPLGPALPVETVAWLIERCPLVSYVKEETPPCGHRITALLAKASDWVLGVFGGGGGRFVLDELARGVTGSMPACEFTSIHVEIYEHFRSGMFAPRGGFSTCFCRS